jgi:hypothetical protein
MPDSEWTRCNERLATPSSSGQDAMSGFCERGPQGAMDNTAVWDATFHKNLLSPSGYNSRVHSTLTEVAVSLATVTHFY